jgi:hypothetical protein
MNFIFHLDQNKLTNLSKLGLNVNHLRKPLDGMKRPPFIYEIVFTINYTSDLIKQNDELVCYDICDSKFYKKETLLKGIWTCKNNIYPKRLIKLMNDDFRKNALLERFEMMLSILTTTIADN